ncbi:MAG: extracellular solute-binding protein [Cyanobacteria bacterium J06639_14]
MDRRTVLLGLATLAVGQVACQQNTGETLRISALKGTLPPRLVGAFKQAQLDPVNLKVDTQSDMVRLFHWLQQWQTTDETTRRLLPFDVFGRSRPAMLPDWVSLSDYWLTAAIQQQLILPLAADSIPAWSELPDIWRSHLRRNQEGLLSQQGALWATPYRWGSLVMVYSRRHFERISWRPTHWKDIWNPEIAGRVSLPNHPRLVLGLVLKSLDSSANVSDPAAQSGFTEAIESLSRQVKVYDSRDYLQPLLQGDTWLAVGWSTDVRPVLAQYRQLDASLPDPGTLLSADVWVKPRGQSSSENAAMLTPLDKAWLGYWWQPDITTPFSLFSDGLSPLLVAPNVVTDAADLSPDKVLLPTTEQLQNSEFLEPLLPEGVERYTKIWEDLRGRE